MFVVFVRLCFVLVVVVVVVVVVLVIVVVLVVVVFVVVVVVQSEWCLLDISQKLVGLVSFPLCAVKHIVDICC